MTDTKERIREIKEMYCDKLPKLDSDWPPKIKIVEKSICDHLFDKKLSVSWLKKQYRINGNNFSGKFTFYVEMSPQQYYMYHRIEVAKKLLSALELKDITITQIALHLGFKSPTSFSTTFKNNVGCTPSEFRDRNN